MRLSKHLLRLGLEVSDDGVGKDFNILRPDRPAPANADFNDKAKIYKRTIQL